MAIRTPDQRLRVFVSSTLGELAAERRAVSRAIAALRLTPVLFELGARPHPPQELYRAYLDQSDVFIGLYWQRYGWIGPGMHPHGDHDHLQRLARHGGRGGTVSSARPSRLVLLQPPYDRVLAEAGRRVRGQRHESLSQLGQTGPGARKPRVMAIDDSYVVRGERNRDAKGTDILGDHDPPFRRSYFEHARVAGSA